jgi:hypothetical protein
VVLPLRSFRWHRVPPGIRQGMSLLLPLPPFPPFRFGRRGWRLRPGPRELVQQPLPLPALLPPLPLPLRPALLSLGRFYLEWLRRSVPLTLQPPPLVLLLAPFRRRRRRRGFRRPLFPPLLLRERLLPVRRRRGIRRWLIASLAALIRRRRPSPFAVFGRRRTRRRLRPLLTSVVVHRVRTRLPLSSRLHGLRVIGWPPRPLLNIRRPFPHHRRRPFPHHRRRASIG